MRTHGNGTIDPYPLIPGEAAKILRITEPMFLWIKDSYKRFRRSLMGRPAKRSSRHEPLRRAPSSPEKPKTLKRYFSTYEPTNAIYTNTSDFRRWCRVTEWFNKFAHGAENKQKTFNLKKMDT